MQQDNITKARSKVAMPSCAAGATNRIDLFVKEVAAPGFTPIAVPELDREIEIRAAKVQRFDSCIQPNPVFRELPKKRWQPRHQPMVRKSRVDSQVNGVSDLLSQDPLGDRLEFVKEAGNFLSEGTPDFCQLDCTRTALKKLYTEVGLQDANLSTNGNLGDAHLICGGGECLVPASDSKGPQWVERQDYMTFIHEFWLSLSDEMVRSVSQAWG